MSNVKTELRAVRLFQVFAAAGRPLRLTELASQMVMAPSSCFALLRAMVAEGYLYELGPRGGFYPTGRMHEHTGLISQHDPVLERCGDALRRLRDVTGETVTIGKQVGNGLLYIAAFESPNNIRLAVLAGAVRPLHGAAMGKALLGSLDEKTLHAVLGDDPLQRLTARTIVSRRKLEVELQVARQRGWYASSGESIEGAMGIALPVRINGVIYAVQVAGPVERMQASLNAHLAALQDAARQIQDRLVAPARTPPPAGVRKKRQVTMPR